MKVAITQPNYLPWLGFFELLDSVDVWVSLDNVQLTKRSFIVRNRVVDTKGGVHWLSMKLRRAPQETLILDGGVCPDFVESHLNKLGSYYRHAPHFEETFEFLRHILPIKNVHESVAQYNERLILGICEYVGITLKFTRSSVLKNPLEGTPESKIIELCDLLNVDKLYTFKNGVENNLYHPENFRRNGIALFQQLYLHPVYSQLSQTFSSHLSVIDLLFNEGRFRALSIIQSGRNWKRLE